MQVEGARRGTGRSREEIGHLTIGWEQGHGDQAGAPGSLKLQHIPTIARDKLGRPAEHPAMPDEKVLNMTSFISVLATVVHDFAVETGHREKGCASAPEKTLPAATDAARSRRWRQGARR